MTTLHQNQRIAGRHFKPKSDVAAEQREHRRYDLGGQTLMINRWDAARRDAKPLGYLVDLSAGGVRLRTDQANVRTDSQIRVRLELPSYAGICPFIDTGAGQPQPKTEWVGWLAVTRVKKVDGRQFDVAGRLVDMDEMDRGMLGLYLSTQPLAA
ncbi:MAG TPA: PilZ domain-containing protein [Tepidisphaeraceae bacterium]|jgi:hypothetical protein